MQKMPAVVVVVLFSVALCLAQDSRTDRRFSIVVLPDTQHYVDGEGPAAALDAQFDWIIANQRSLGIEFVTHLGDLVEAAGSEIEWKIMRAAFNRLDVAGIPYGVLPGNHDQPYSSKSFYTKYFGENAGRAFAVPNFSEYPWWGGSYKYGNGPVANVANFQQLVINGQPFLILHLGWMSNFEEMQAETTLNEESGDSIYVLRAKGQLRWADEVLKAHPDHRAIVVTHAFLSVLDGQPVRRIQGHPLLSTEFIWDKLIVPNPNVFLVLNGHELGRQAEIHRSDRIGNRVVHQMLSNYQSRSRGGDGWLRILEFSLGTNTLSVRTYSPFLNTEESDANSAFTLDLGGAFTKTVSGPAAPVNLRIVR
jgi:hypothetical protein